MENKSEVLVRETGQAMIVSSKSEARSFKLFLKSKSNTYYILLACVAVDMQHAMRMCHVFFYDPYGCKIFFPCYLTHYTIFGKKKNY